MMHCKCLEVSSGEVPLRVLANNGPARPLFRRIGPANDQHWPAHVGQHNCQTAPELAGIVGLNFLGRVASNSFSPFGFSARIGSHMANHIIVRSAGFGPDHVRGSGFGDIPLFFSEFGRGADVRGPDAILELGSATTVVSGKSCASSNSEPRAHMFGLKLAVRASGRPWATSVIDIVQGVAPTPEGQVSSTSCQTRPNSPSFGRFRIELGRHWTGNGRFRPHSVQH